MLNELGIDSQANANWQQNTSDLFSNDPFAPSASSSFGFEHGVKTSVSDPDLKQHQNNPFSQSTDPWQQNGQKRMSISKSKSMDFSFGDDSFGNQPASTGQWQADFLSTGNTDLFAPQQNNTASTNDAWNTPNTSGVTNNFDAFGSLEPTVQPIATSDTVFTPLEPTKPSEPSKKNDDPFSALSGDIMGIKGALPAGAADAAKFPTKQKTPTSRQPLKITPSPTSVSPVPFTQPQMSPQTNFGQPQSGHMSPQTSFGQQQPGPFAQSQGFGGTAFTQSQNFGGTPVAQSQQFAQTNPFGQQSQSSMPPIPPRADLFSPTSVHAPASFSGQTHPGPGFNWQQPGASIPKPSMPPSLPPRVDLFGTQPPAGNDPFASLDQPNAVYAQVDKSQKRQKSNDPFFGNTASNPASSDLMSGFGGPTATSASKCSSLDPFGDAFGTSGSTQVSANTGNASSSNVSIHRYFVDILKFMSTFDTHRFIEVKYNSAQTIFRRSLILKPSSVSVCSSLR